MARRWWLVSLAIVVALGGCGESRLRQQARDALDRYDQAVAAAGGQQGFAPVGELTGQVGTWEPDKADNKAALLSGRVVAAGPLPAATASTGEVAWSDGTIRVLPLASADQALRQLVEAGAGECSRCVTLQVTGARLTTMRIETTRGAATAPAWEYTLDATAVRITRVAVASSAAVTVVPPPWDPYDSPAGLRIDSATTTVDGTRLTVSFTGALGSAAEPCGADYIGEAVEGANAVVVIVNIHSNGGACPDIGYPRTTTVELGRPLGDRAVLEVVQGLPVPVTMTT